MVQEGARAHLLVVLSDGQLYIPVVIPRDVAQEVQYAKNKSLVQFCAHRVLEHSGHKIVVIDALTRVALHPVQIGTPKHVQVL